MPPSYMCDLYSGKSHSTGGNKRRSKNKLQQQEGIQANSPLQSCTCSKKHYGLPYKSWKQEKKSLAASVRDGNVPPAAKENSGIE